MDYRAALAGALQAMQPAGQASVASFALDMAMRKAARELAEEARLRAAHLRKFSYQITGTAGHNRKKQPVLELRRHQIDTKRYTGEDIRRLEAERGCGKRKPLDQHSYVRMALPWSTQIRVVGFLLVTNEDGKTVIDTTQFKLLKPRKGRNPKRDRRGERELSDAKVSLLVKAIAAEMKQRAKFSLTV